MIKKNTSSAIKEYVSGALVGGFQRLEEGVLEDALENPEECRRETGISPRGLRNIAQVGIMFDLWMCLKERDPFTSVDEAMEIYAKHLAPVFATFWPPEYEGIGNLKRRYEVAKRRSLKSFYSN